MIFLFLSPSFAEAANLVISPVNKNVDVGNIFTINVNVSAPSENINAVSGSVSFDSSRLEVVSVSKNSSIINFWVQEPNFSNSSGTISFEGVSLSSGYQGPSGNIVTVTFKAIKSGSALIDLSSGSILANDGLGTEVLSSLVDGTVNVSAGTPSQEPEKEVEIKAIAERGILIDSNSHPDEEAWYSNDTVTFSFDISDEADSVQTILSERRNTTPSVTYSPPITEKTIEDLDDGVWYFHIRQRVNGTWSKVYTRKIKIDTTSPVIKDVSVYGVSNLTNPVRTIEIDSYDDTSGIEKYEIYLGDTLIDEIKASGYYEYQTPNLYPGKHEIKIVAVDFAGLKDSRSVTIEVEGIEKPKVNKFKDIVNQEEAIVVEGRADSDKVVIFLATEEQGLSATVGNIIGSKEEILFSYIVDVDENGRFKFEISEDLEAGRYVIWVQGKNDDGSASYFTEKYTVLVKGKGIVGVLSVFNKYLTGIVVTIALLVIVVLLYLVLRYKLAIFQKRMQRRMRNPEHLLYDELELLQSNIDSHLEILHRIQRGTNLSRKELTQIGTLMNQLKRTEIMLQRSLDGVGVKEVPKPEKPNKNSSSGVKVKVNNKKKK